MTRSLLLQLARLPPDLQQTFVSLFTTQLSYAQNVLSDHAVDTNLQDVNLMSITLASFKQTLTVFERDMHQAVQTAIKDANNNAAVISYSFDAPSPSHKQSIDEDCDALQSVQILSPTQAQHSHQIPKSASSSKPVSLSSHLAISTASPSPRRINQRSPMRLQPVKEQSWEHSQTDENLPIVNQPRSGARSPIVPPIELPSGSPAVLDAICSAQMSNRSRKYMTAPHDLASMMAEWQASNMHKASNLSSRVLNETASPACSSPSSISSNMHSSKSTLDRTRSMSQSQHASDSSDDSDSDSDDEPGETKRKQSNDASSPPNLHNMFVRGAATMRHEEVRLMMNWMKETNKQNSEPKPT